MMMVTSVAAAASAMMIRSVRVLANRSDPTAVRKRIPQAMTLASASAACVDTGPGCASLSPRGAMRLSPVTLAKNNSCRRHRDHAYRELADLGVKHWANTQG